LPARYEGQKHEISAAQAAQTTSRFQVQTPQAAMVDADETSVEIDGELQRREQLLPVHHQNHFQGAERKAQSLNISRIFVT